MHWYRAAALTPCKTLRLCSSALLPWAPECDYAVIYHSLVKIQIKAASCAAAARAGAVGAPGRSLGHRPATAPSQGAAALCCQVLGAEGSIVSFTVFQERKIHLESDQKIYFDRN